MRGFRIAARLGLSLSRETEAAILTYSSLVKSFDKVTQLKFYDDGMLPEWATHPVRIYFVVAAAYCLNLE